MHYENGLATQDAGEAVACAAGNALNHFLKRRENGWATTIGSGRRIAGRSRTKRWIGFRPVASESLVGNTRVVLFGSRPALKCMCITRRCSGGHRRFPNNLAIAETCLMG